ncbi:MAG: substrate-binding domain-containing protein [Phycisphaerae bacterium]|nr:substrate-binding domain-containing protein [Phycisphaerae bacterium]
MKPRNVIISILAIAMAVLFVSCTKKEGADKKKDIFVIPKGTGSTWWEVVHDGAKKAVEGTDYNIVWDGPQQETDRERQIQVVDDAIVQQVAGIVLGPNDFQALARSVKKIKNAGIPCVIIDSAVDADQADYITFIATDNHKGGANAAQRLGKAMGGKGNIILTKFVQNSASTDARTVGFKETIAKEFPEIKILDEQYTMGDVENARQKTVDMLMNNKDVTGIFAVNLTSSIGAYKALKSQDMGDKVTMVGFDSDPILLKGLQDGDLEALIVQNPFEIGFQGVKAIIGAIEGKTFQKKQAVESWIVDKENLAEMKEKYPAALGL